MVCFCQPTRSATSGFSARSNQTFVVEDGYLSARNALFAPRYDDSTQANTFLSAINKDTLGNVVYLYSTNSLWVRTISSGTTKKWLEIGSGGGGSGITIGSTTITSGTNTRVLFNNSGVVGEYSISGTVNVAMTTSPLFTTPRLSSTSTTGYVWTATDASGNGSFQAIPADNLIVQRAGEVSGSIQTWYSSGDSLYLEDIKGSTYINALKSADSTIIISLIAADYGDITVGASTWTIDNDVVTFAKFQNIAQARLLGRYTASTGDMQEISLGSGLSLDAGTGVLSSTGGGDVTKVGTPVNNQLGVWTGNGTIEGDANLTFASSTLNIGVAGSATGILTLSGVTSGIVTIQPASVAGTYTLTLPIDDGTASQFLQTNGAGVLSWSTPAGSGDVVKVGTPVNNQLGVWTGDGTIEGDANLTFASSTLNIGVAGASTGIFTQSGVTSGTITFQPASVAGTYTLTWPTTDGGSGEFLQTNGSGVLTWAAGGGTPALTQYRLAVGDASNLLSTGAAITGNRALISDANGVPTHSATTATELGYVNGVTSSIQTQLDKEIGIIQSATYTLTSTTATQKLFDAVTNGEITVAANTTYQFECMFSLTSMSATSGNCGFDVLGAGTATFTSVTWISTARDATNLNVAVSPSTVFSSAAAQTGDIATPATTTGLYAVVRGTIRVNAGGTIIPSTNLANAAAAVVGVNSYFKLTPIGSSSVTSW